MRPASNVGLCRATSDRAGRWCEPARALNRVPQHDLFLTVALPSWLRGSRGGARPGRRQPCWVASALLATELLVQIPFLGFSVLQLIFGTVAIGMAVLAFLARKEGWWPGGRPKEPGVTATADDLFM